MYGHIRQLAEAEKKGIEKAGGTADLFQYVSPSHIHLYIMTYVYQETNTPTESQRPSPKKSSPKWAPPQKQQTSPS